MRKRKFTSLEVPAETKCGSGLTHTWKSWQNKCGRWTRSFEVLAERKYGKRNFRSLALKAEQKCGSGTSHLWKSRQRWNAEVNVSIFGSLGRTSAEDERDLRSPGRAEVWKAELQIFVSKDRAELRKQSFRPLKVIAGRIPGRDEMRKWIYPYLEVWQNKSGWWTRSFEVLAERKYGKRNFRSLAVKTERNCGSEASNL